MLFFRSKEQKELDFLLEELKNYLSNNYKDAAHDCRRLLGEKSEQYYQEKTPKIKQYRRYSELYRKYTAIMKDYHH